jgi:hypothetical protein
MTRKLPIKLSAHVDFPIVSVYDFEHLYGQQVVERLLKDCSIYIIAQRRAIFFTDIIKEDIKKGILFCQITDGHTTPLLCQFKIPVEEWDIIETQFKFYTVKDRLLDMKKSSSDNIEAIQFRRDKGKEPIWITPYGFIHRHFHEPAFYKKIGDISSYLNHKIHYIGQATKQNLTKRLAHHRKLLKILTLEEPLNEQHISTPHELAFLFLKLLPENDAICRNTITTEAESALINKFKPNYNEILFDNYPKIKNGMQSINKELVSIIIKNYPVRFFTDHHIMKTSEIKCG